ncbi:MAG: peptide chain release factor N(5)-glutamine methyltransferase [Ferruginibacter sp.]|nr:peptide chain release factor N(5)-glutamine methyltransferase [Ferruginibacter sp.]
MFAYVTIQEIHRHYLNELSLIYSKNESAQITHMIFEDIAGISRSEIIKKPLEPLPSLISEKLDSCLARLMQHEPVQYVIGHTWFYKLKLKVNPTVLIPRPETEELVSEAVDFLKTKKQPSILDIGSGSGCIPIALKKNIPEAEVSSIDISKEALEIAGENAKLNGVSVNFKQTDFLSQKNWNTFGKYHVIISNPPYIPLSEKNTMDINVIKYEPYLALFVDNRNPLIFYHKIASFGKLRLKKEGKIFLEVHENYAQQVKDVFQNENYTTEVKKDIFGKERIIVATHCRLQ